MRDAQLASLAPLAAPLKGLRVLYWGGSGRGFPGGDGPIEATEVLPAVGVDLVYTHEGDPAQSEKLSWYYDVAIITNTRTAALMAADRRIWTAGKRTAWSFWDLRPGDVGAPLRGKPDRVFLSYSGPWTSPRGDVYEPAQWAAALGCPVSYCPQGTSLREPLRTPDGPRVLFVGDLSNPTYHRGRSELCKSVSARVMNFRDRPGRLALEGRLPELYRSARYVLSASPLAPGYTSVRTYSILACGGLMMLHRFPGAERLFRDGEHAVFFDTADELKARLEELDGDPAKRDAIADAGRLIHATRHTVAHRVLSICREMMGVSEGFSGWL